MAKNIFTRFKKNMTRRDFYLISKSFFRSCLKLLSVLNHLLILKHIHSVFRIGQNITNIAVKHPISFRTMYSIDISPNIKDIANSLDSLGYDISEFVNYIDDVIENGLTVKYSINTSGGDAVKIMNIHKSKGLEFSLCYFTGMHNKFTIKEINDKILFFIMSPYFLIQK